jgi:hypothetical protein
MPLIIPPLLILSLIALAPAGASAATWQFAIPFPTGQTEHDGTAKRGMAMVWLPPGADAIRGVLVGGQLGIEAEIALDPEVRAACAANAIAIVYFVPHTFAVFHYWEDGNTDAARWLQAFAGIAKGSGHPEIERVPWITMGHSTAGIFCRNIGYWQGERVAGIIQIKSGNLFQQDQRPPNGSLVGIPLLAINGQFEHYGPVGGLLPDLGRETQWMMVRKDLLQLRSQDPGNLVSTWIDPGGDHHHGSPELSAYVALFIRKTALLRIPARVPAGDGPIACLPLKPEDGWLSDADLYSPHVPPASYRDYLGDRSQAMWHYDREIAEADVEHHRLLGAHQFLQSPVLSWRDDGDGWTFSAHADWLGVLPDDYGSANAGRVVGHSDTAIIYRCKIEEPVIQIGPDAFRLLRPVKAVNIAAFNAGDGHFRSTSRWSRLEVPHPAGAPQTLTFQPIPDLAADGPGCAITATASSGLPVVFTIDHGPVTVVDGTIAISELPQHARFPIPCRITAWQLGRRTAPAIASVSAVRDFLVVKP